MADEHNTRNRVSRRAFIKGAGVGAAAAAVAGLYNPAIDQASENPPADTPISHPAGVIERLGPNPVSIELTINGSAHAVRVEPRVTLLEVLRDKLGLTGAKTVCDRGACGACTIHLDGRAVNACMMLAVDARAHEIITVEGLGDAAHLDPVQSAFVEFDALQCGFCTPGMIMSIVALIRQNPSPTLDEIKHAVAGNTCRCGTYPHVFAAALAAVARLSGRKPAGVRA
jgi:xanthine dehydrogenase YagT iron-sulfur-binding subunit